MTRSSPAADGDTVDGVSIVTEHRTTIVSLAIVLLVSVPVAAIALQIAPVTSSLPVAKDFRMVDTQTLDSFRLNDLHGKVVLLDLMATTCDACRKSMPDLLSIDATYDGAPFVLLSVTTVPWDSPATMETFRKEYLANWTFAVPVDRDQVAADYEVTGFPTYVVVDPEGRITYRAVGLVPLETLTSHIGEALRA